MATLENGKNNAECSTRGILFEFQSRDLPSRRLLGKGLSGIGYETAWEGARHARKDFVGVQRDIFLQEATVLVGLKDHKNIVKTHGWTVDKRSCSLILEYMDEDLLSLLQKRMDSKRGVVGKDLGKQSSTWTCTQPVDLPEAVDMMLQIATGMEYLHEQGLAHGDLKTKNILVTHRKDGDPSSNVLKVSDFGLVGTKKKSRYIVSRKVRKLDMVRWKSPESLKLLSRRLHSSSGDEDETSSESESESTPGSVPELSSACAGMKSSDVYSFALICCQILTGHTPYPDLDWEELLVAILSGCTPDLPVSCHPLLRELLISCWGDPAQRPSFSAVRMKLIQVQGLFTTAMGKRPQEAAAPSVADSRAHQAHQAAVVPSTEVSTSSGNCLSPKGPAIVPSEWTASVAATRSSAPGVPSAVASTPSPPATVAASPAPDESCVEIGSVVVSKTSSEPTQSADLALRLEEPLLRDSMAEFDPSGKRFLDLSMDQYVDQFVTTSSELNNDPTIGRGSNLAVTSFCTPWFRDTGSANDIKTGTMDLAWRKTRFLSHDLSRHGEKHAFSPPAHWGSRKREKSENQSLLRRSFQFLTLQRQGTHGAVSQSIGSQGPPLTCSATSVPNRGADTASMVHRKAERNRRVQLSEKFAALRRLVPVNSKSDKVSILGDAITYLEALKREIDELETSKSQVERQHEDLKLSHQDMEQRNQQLEASKSQVERQYEDLKLSHQVLEQQNQQLEASKSPVERQYEDLKLSHQVLEQQNRQLDRQYEGLKLSHQDLERRNQLLEARTNGEVV